MESRQKKQGSEEIAKPDVQFDEIAFLYDDLMAGVPYGVWADYIQRILNRFEFIPETVLDLCCGTGSVSFRLAFQGYEVTGADISAEMIAQAEKNAQKLGIKADFHVQDAAKLRLGKRFDLVVSLFDSLNYILDASALQEAFYRVYDHLEPGGLFIFDMNTELALAEGMFNQSNVGSSASTIYDWHSSYDPSTRICRVNMDFIHRGKDKDRKVHIVHYQRAYNVEEITDMLKSADLSILDIYDAYTFKKVTSHSDRVFFVVRK